MNTNVNINIDLPMIIRYLDDYDSNASFLFDKYRSLITSFNKLSDNITGASIQKDIAALVEELNSRIKEGETCVKEIKIFLKTQFNNYINTYEGALQRLNYVYDKISSMSILMADIK